MLDATRIRIAEGASATVGVKLVRNGSSGPVVVTVSRLPAGVTADPLTIDAESGTLTLHAAAGVTQGEAALTVTATGTDHAHDLPLSLLAMGLPGTPDKTFGSGGALPAPLAGHGESIAIQPDGKILIAGWVIQGNHADYMVARYLSDGTVDTSFANGMRILDPSVLVRPALALQPDGKIIIAETTGGRTPQPAVFRLNAADGSRDSQFGVDGREEFDLSDPGGEHSTVLLAVAALPNGNIVVAGHADAIVNGVTTEQAVVARITSKGELDEHFGSAGRTFTGLGFPTASFLGLAPQSDGRIIAVGLAGPDMLMAFAHFGPEGNLDSSSYGGGFFAFAHRSTDIGAAIALQPDGKVVAAGGDSNGEGGTYLARLNGDAASPDDDFGVAGFYTLKLTGGTNFATGLALQSDGKYVIVGNTGGQGPFIARILPNQLLDSGFGNAGLAMPVTGAGASQFEAVALDADGRIVVTGFRTTASGAPAELLLYRFWP